MYIGAIMTFDYWHATDNVLDGWRLIVLGISVLLMRRLPFVVSFVSLRLAPLIVLYHARSQRLEGSRLCRVLRTNRLAPR